MSANDAFFNPNEYKTQMHALLCSTFQNSLNSTLSAEIENFMKSERMKGQNNYRNGYTQRSLSTQLGRLEIKAPRDRLSRFHSKIVPPYARIEKDLRDNIDSIILSSLSYLQSSRLASLIDCSADFTISESTISRYAKLLAKKLDNINSLTLPKSLVAVFLDTTYFDFKTPENKVIKIGLSIALGLDEQKHYSVLAFEAVKSESTDTYVLLLSSLRRRGLKKVSLFVSDRCAGISAAVDKVYPKSPCQTCIVHLKRNLTKDRVCRLSEGFMEEFDKTIDKRLTYTEAVQKYHELYKHYHSDMPTSPFWNIPPYEIYAFLYLPKKYRKSIYTSNPIEGLNSLIKRRLRSRIVSSETTLTIDINSVFIQFNENQKLKR